MRSQQNSVHDIFERDIGICLHEASRLTRESITVLGLGKNDESE